MGSAFQDPGPAAVLLCAGGSTRMGRPKPLLPWGDQTLLEAHLETLDGWRVFVVTGARAAELRPLLAGCTEVYNERWRSTSMGESAQLAARLFQTRAVFTPIDTVPDARILRQLRERTVTTVPVDVHGRRGHPVLLSSDDVGRLARQPRPSLRMLTASASLLSTSSELCAEDFDTPLALARVRKGVSG